jgi:arylesterase / paraoxonase
MTRPIYRFAVTLSAVLLVTALIGGFRMLQSHGAFTEVKPGFAGTCRAIATAGGPEDIALDRVAKVAFISAMDRRAFKRGQPSKGDGLYSYEYGKPGAKPVKLSGTPADFHPHGISLIRDAEGHLTLMAINHRGDGSNTIDVFSVDYGEKPVPDNIQRVYLTEVGNIGSGLLTGPNDLAAIDDDRFYVVNDHVSKTWLGRWLDDNLVLPRTNILYFDGAKFLIGAKDQNFPDGAMLSKDGRYLYVPERYVRQLAVFEREPFTGRLKEAGRFDIPSNLDNADFDAEGNLWIASHPKAFAMDAFRADINKPAPSVVYKVTMKGGIPVGYTQVYADMGSQIGGASVAAADGKTLLIGSALDRKILNCTMP